MNRNIVQRLFDRRIIDPTTECWLWDGSKFSNGYGSIKFKGKTESVHRLSLILFKGVNFNVNEQANHVVKCPNKHCFNPDHLYVGTQQENNQDKFQGKKPKTKKQKNREYYLRKKLKSVDT